MTTESQEIRNLRKGLGELHAEAVMNSRVCSVEEVGSWSSFSRKILQVLRTAPASKLTTPTQNDPPSTSII